MKCELCKTNEAKLNICAGDNRMHHHGMVHAHPLTYKGNSTNHLMALCNDCAKIDRLNWETSRKYSEMKVNNG